MSKPKFITVTKIDAAQRQVNTAIELWFADGDPVSIHTLLYASVEIIHSLYKRATGEQLFFDNSALKGRTDLVRLIKDWPNFFKHGRAYELDRVLAFNPGANLVLFSACMAGLARLGTTRVELHDALAYWLLIHEPDYFPASELEKRPTGERLRQIQRVNKKEFLKAFLKGKRRRRRESR